MTAEMYDFSGRYQPEREFTGLPSGGNGGGMDGERLIAIEKRMDTVEAKLDKLSEAITALRVDVAAMRGRLDAVPTIWQMITLVFGILGGAFVILKFGLHP